MNIPNYSLTVPLGQHDGREWWLAQHVDTGKAVAIAVLRDGDDRATFELIDEARRRAREPGFIALGRCDNHYYMVLEPDQVPATTRN